MAKKLTKEKLLEYGITHVEVVGPCVFVKINGKLTKPTKADKITVSDKNKPLRLYKCGIRVPRTQIPLARIAYAWENGFIEANQVAKYDLKSNRYVAVSYSDFHKEVLLKWAKKQKGEEQ